MHPSNKVSKGYFVKVQGLVKYESLSILRNGPIINKLKYQPVRVKILNNINNKTWLEIIIREGKNRQIKKMLLSLGHQVQKIKRFKVGPISLGNLKSGEYRALNNNELRLLLDN
jgi:23S rRNA pseudouridine2605 synthase